MRVVGASMTNLEGGHQRTTKSPAWRGFESLVPAVLNHRTRVLVIGITGSFVGVMLDQVLAANTQPHGDGGSHEHG